LLLFNVWRVDRALWKMSCRRTEKTAAPPVQRVDVDLERMQHRFGRLLEGAKDRLTADDDEFVLGCHLRCRRDDMLELPRAHLCHLA
jgi:hypothetical protein